MRLPKIILIVGGRGTGKTTYVENLLSSNRANALIVEMFVTDRYKEYPNRSTFDKLKLSDCVNKRIVIEDATQYITAGGSKFLRQLIVSSKQLGSDVYIIFHSCNFVPPFLLAMFDFLLLFPCEPVRKTPALAPYLPKIEAAQRKRAQQYKPLAVIQAV